MSDDDHGFGDDNTEARRRRGFGLRTPERTPERRDPTPAPTPLDAHRKESGQRHEATRERIEQVSRDALSAIVALDTRIKKIEEQVEKIAEGQAHTHTQIERGRGALWLGTGLAGAVLLGVVALIGATIEARQSNAVQDVDIARLHAEDETSRVERRELRDAVTRTAASVERVAGAVESQDRRLDDAEDEIRTMRRPGEGR